LKILPFNCSRGNLKTFEILLTFGTSADEASKILKEETKRGALFSVPFSAIAALMYVAINGVHFWNECEKRK